MDKLSIGHVIFKLRKEKAITQEQLGIFIGVSTAAVSKWESGVSYPDITLLPTLASFFNVTIDKLMNFRIELSDEEVMKIFKECEKIFSSGKIEMAIEKSKEYINKYPTSYYLKLRIGYLFTMYSWKSENEENAEQMIKISIKLFEEVAENSNNMELVETALFQLGALYEDPEKAIEALNKIHKSKCDPDDILSSIYIKRGDIRKGRELLQGKLYKAMIDIRNSAIGLANSYKDDLYMIEKCYKMAVDIKKFFFNENPSFSSAIEYLILSQSYLKFNKIEEAIKPLNEMLNDLRKNDINKPIKFSSVWCFNELKENKRSITVSLYENIFKILEEPLFDVLRDKNEFKNIVEEVRNLEKKSLNTSM